MRLLAIALRMDVRAAGETDAVEAGQQRADRVGTERRDDERDRSCPLDGPHVGEPERHLVAGRLALGGRLHGFGLADL